MTMLNRAHDADRQKKHICTG